MRANLRDLARASNFDPKTALLEAAGDLSVYDIFHNLVLVATYVGPEKVGSIIMPDKTLAENRFQGKVGLVLKKGPLAFKDDSIAKFGGADIAVGDWIIFRPSDGDEMFIKDCSQDSGRHDGLSVRLIEDSLIKGRVADPAFIY